jgi:hypothetical protein
MTTSGFDFSDEKSKYFNCVTTRSGSLTESVVTNRRLLLLFLEAKIELELSKSQVFLGNENKGFWIKRRRSDDRAQSKSHRK